MEVFNLFAKLSLDTSEYEKGLKNAGEAAKGIGGKVKKALDVVTKASAAAVSTGAAAAGKIVKDSVAAYGDYEQLVGGVETLFGDSANKVLKNADNAFKTAGMSVNQYMETSIQSAAALINSLGGDQAKAAELMDLSITDMSDKMLVRVKRIELYQRCA